MLAYIYGEYYNKRFLVDGFLIEKEKN